MAEKATTEQRLAHLEAEMTVIQREINELRGLSMRVVSIESEIQGLRKGQEEGTERVLEEIGRLREPVARDDYPPIWASDSGRQVIRMVVIGAVLCSLAIGGSLTAEQALRWVLGAHPQAQVVDGTSGPTHSHNPGQPKPTP